MSDLNLGEIINGGSCSDIYNFSPGVLFKAFNDDYRDLNDSINLEFLDTIKTISSISNLDFTVKAIDIYRSRFELFGYTMEEINALKFEDLSDEILVFDVILAFERLKSDIRKLSDYYVKTEDIGGDNILYNGNMYLLDLDLSLVDKRYVPDELYQNTRKNIFKCLFYRLTGSGFDGNVLNDDYVEYINRVLDDSSNVAGVEPKTIGEFKRVYQKYKKTIQ